MFINTYINIKEKKEYIGLLTDISIAAGSAFYGKHMLSSEIYDDICFSGHFSEKLFYTACDLLSLDYQKIITNIAQVAIKNITKEQFADEATELLLSEHPCFFDKSIGDGLCFAFDDIQNLRRSTWDKLIESGDLLDASNDINYPQKRISNAFEKILHIIEYLDESLNNKTLRKADMFRLYLQKLDIPLIDFLPEASDEETKRFFDYDNNSPYEYDKFHLNDFLGRVKNRDEVVKLEIADCGVEAFLGANIYFIMLNGYSINRCKNCGKFFVAYNRSDTKYCDRLSVQDKERTCKQYGTQKLWYDNLDEAGRLYRKIYSRKKMRIRRYPDLEKHKIDFKRFKDEAEKKRIEVMNKILAEKEYLEWLLKEDEKG